MAQSVQLVIKSPSSSVGDFNIEMDLSKDVGYLKQQLTERHPLKPLVERQKLIFAGKLLQNESPLLEVLSQYDTTIPQSFHLVISKPTTTSLPQNSPQPRFQPGFIPQNINYQQFQYQFQLNNRNPQFNGVGQINPQQFAQQQQPQAQPQVVPDNANRGDGTSTFYLLFRLALLVYILSSGGGSFRLFVLSVGAVLIFLYQTGILRITTFITVHHAQNIPQNPQNRQQENENQEEVQQDQPPVERQPQPQNQNRGLFGEISALILPFFCSLFPTWQPNAVANPVPVPNPVPVVGEQQFR